MDAAWQTTVQGACIMWKVLGSKAQILKYGMTHLQNKQKGRKKQIARFSAVGIESQV